MRTDRTTCSSISSSDKVNHFTFFFHHIFRGFSVEQKSKTLTDFADIFTVVC